MLLRIFIFSYQTARSSYIKFHQSQIESNKKCLLMTELLYFLLEMNNIVCVILAYFFSEYKSFHNLCSLSRYGEFSRHPLFHFSLFLYAGYSSVLNISAQLMVRSHFLLCFVTPIVNIVKQVSSCHIFSCVVSAKCIIENLLLLTSLCHLLPLPLYHLNSLLVMSINKHKIFI
jgi:hypothetical protein